MSYFYHSIFCLKRNDIRNTESALPFQQQLQTQYQKHWFSFHGFCTDCTLHTTLWNQLPAVGTRRIFCVWNRDNYCRGPFCQHRHPPQFPAKALHPEALDHPEGDHLEQLDVFQPLHPVCIDGMDCQTNELHHIAITENRFPGYVTPIALQHHIVQQGTITQADECD